MINTVIESVSSSLNAEFGSNYEIYREMTGQELKERSFLISCLSSGSRPFPGKRYFRENLFGIRYAPKREGREREECSAVAERLFSCLEYLTVEGRTIRGTGMKYEITEGILNFMVNYNLFVCRNGEGIPAMEEISGEISAKEQGKNQV